MLEKLCESFADGDGDAVAEACDSIVFRSMDTDVRGVEIREGREGRGDVERGRPVEKYKKEKEERNEMLSRLLHDCVSKPLRTYIVSIVLLGNQCSI